MSNFRCWLALCFVLSVLSVLLSVLLSCRIFVVGWHCVLYGVCAIVSAIVCQLLNVSDVSAALPVNASTGRACMLLLFFFLDVADRVCDY